MYKTFQPMVKWVYRVESVDMENVPDCGVILACNHTSFADVLVLSAALRRQVRSQRLNSSPSLQADSLPAEPQGKPRGL